MSESVMATQAKLDLEQTDRIVMSEGALRRERIVCWVRLAAIAGWASTMAVVGIVRDPYPEYWRAGIGTVYLLWSLGALYGVRKALSQARTGSWVRRVDAWSVATPMFDTGFCIALLTAPVPPGADITALPALHPERV